MDNITIEKVLNALIESLHPQIQLIEIQQEKMESGGIQWREKQGEITGIRGSLTALYLARATMR